jgi:RNA polymerase sigma-70 factor (ECF subfamily)
MLSAARYQHWLGVCRRHARRREEAEDLLHSALISAIAAGRRDLADSANAAWFVGVIRNTAAMEGRTSARRRKRELAQVKADQTQPGESHDELGQWLAAVAKLPRGGRSVAVLALHGLNREEIASALALSDVALRQRLTTIRKAWGQIDPANRPSELPRVRSTIRTRLEVGLLRKALIEILQHEGDLGTHDPDGHLIVLTRTSSQNRVRRQR